MTSLAKTLLVVLLVIFPVLHAHAGTINSNGTACLYLQNSTCQAGEHAEIPLFFDPNEKDISLISVDIEFDSQTIHNATAQLGPAGRDAGKWITFRQTSKNMLRILVMGLNNTLLPKGIIAYLNVDIRSAATSGAITIRQTAQGAAPDSQRREVLSPASSLKIIEGSAELSKLTLGQADKREKEPFQVPIVLEKNDYADISSISFALAYNASELKNISIVSSPQTIAGGKKIILSSDNTPGIIKPIAIIGMEDDPSLPIDNGTIAFLQFETIRDSTAQTDIFIRSALGSTSQGFSTDMAGSKNVIVLDMLPPQIDNLTNSLYPTSSTTWTWTTDENATFRFAVDQNPTWNPTGDFSDTSTAIITANAGCGIWYLHVQSRDSAGNMSQVMTVSTIMLPNPVPSCGDIYPDGALTVQDVILALNYVTGDSNLEPWQLDFADVAPLKPTGSSPAWEVCRDGHITIGDVMVLLKAVAGLVEWEGMTVVD